MWNYSEKMMDHFRNPRNVGKIEHPDGTATVGSLACGDALQFQFKLGPDGRIAEAKFQTFGCASAIASSSALTEMVIGKTLDEAKKITNQQIADYLGGLPPQKMHCSVMGREAMEAAIKNYETGENADRNLEDQTLCTCYNVSENEVRRVITENQLTTVEEVTNFTKAGGACGKCKGEIQKILDRILQRPAAPEAPKPSAAAGTPAPMTQFQKMKKIEEVIETEVRPMLRRDGGDLEILDIQGDKVVVAFRGHCAGCIAANFTKNGLVQKKLRDAISKEITVEVVPGEEA